MAGSDGGAVCGLQIIDVLHPGRANVAKVSVVSPRRCF